jgi:hypothetical protein
MKRLCRLLVGAQCGALLLSAWVIFKTIGASEPMPSPVIARAEVTPEEDASDAPERSLEDYAAIWQRDLRQTLIEPEPEEKPKPKPSEPTPPPLPLPKLLATFVEHGIGWGVFVAENGSTRVRAESSRIEEFDIVKISPGKASLRRGGRLYEVKVPKQDAGQTRRGRRRG